MLRQNHVETKVLIVNVKNIVDNSFHLKIIINFAQQTS